MSTTSQLNSSYLWLTDNTDLYFLRPNLSFNFILRDQFLCQPYSKSLFYFSRLHHSSDLYYNLLTTLKDTLAGSDVMMLCEEWAVTHRHVMLRRSVPLGHVPLWWLIHLWYFSLLLLPASHLQIFFLDSLLLL